VDNFKIRNSAEDIKFVVVLIIKRVNPSQRVYRTSRVTCIAIGRALAAARLPNALHMLGSSAARSCCDHPRTLLCPAYLSGIDIGWLTLGPPHPNQCPLEDRPGPMGLMAQVALGLSGRLRRFHEHCWLGKQAAQVGGKAKANGAVQQNL
jgi:hypothetical protein